MEAGALPDGLPAVTWLSPLLPLPDALLMADALLPRPSKLRAAVSLRLV